MKKDAYYFSHDSNAWSDSKILKLRVLYKDRALWAYGLFWVIVEKMRDEPENKLDINNAEELALYIGCDKEEIKIFIKNCIDINLFCSDGEYFWSDSLLRRMQQYYDKCKKAKSAANKRWEVNKESVNDANALPTHSGRNALKESKGKESKVNKRKRNNIKPELTCDDIEVLKTVKGFIPE